MNDTVVVGGGVIGLSIAYELACRDESVILLERDATGRSASWAGAGILPAACEGTATDAAGRLAGLSYELHADWSQRLRSETGIDNGYRRCGGIYLGVTAGESAALGAWALEQAALGITVEQLGPDHIAKLAPALRPPPKLRTAWWMPDECQLRNPRHLAALRAACLNRGVQILEDCRVTSLSHRNDRVRHVAVEDGSRIGGRRIVVAGGSWSGQLLESLGVVLPLEPVRGQMLLYQTPEVMLSCIVNAGSRYLVPRDDGHLLAGSTEEEAGFDASTTEAARTELAGFAESLLPGLGAESLVRHWAGLRPSSRDGLPFIGPLPGWRNAYVATGHFRSGLFLSSGTAHILADLMQDRPPRWDYRPLSVMRA